jgi:hypothetical protein
VLAAAVESLRVRGISDPERWASLGADAIDGAVRWYDAQNGRVNTGVLVSELNAGGKPGWRRAGVNPDDDYAEQVNRWLRTQFPDLVDDQGHPHPAAIVAVMRLHYTVGRGRLTRTEHGPLIRGHVAYFDKQLHDDTGVPE